METFLKNRWTKVLITIIGLLFLNFTNSYSTTEGWTIMVYMCGDNNLTSDALNDLNEMEGAMENVDANVIVLIDQLGADDTKAYEVEYDAGGSTNSTIVSTSIPLDEINESWGDELNMGDGQTLTDFATWAIDNYDAEKYALILWDHGSGWYKSYFEELTVKSICTDNNSSYDNIEMDEFRTSIIDICDATDITKIDLLGMDACMMAMIEVFYQVYGYVDIGVASQETEASDGWEYYFLGDLYWDPYMTAEDLAIGIADAYEYSWTDNASDPTDHEHYTLSVLDVDKLAGLGTTESVVQVTNHLGNLLCSYMYGNYSNINSAQNNCTRFDLGDYPFIDLYDFAENLYDENINSSINTWSEELMDKIDDAVIYEVHGDDRTWAHGISIYFEENENDYKSDYNTTSHYLEFTKYSSWDEMHHAFYNYVSGEIEWDEEINISGDFYVSQNAELIVNDNTEVNLWYLWNSSIRIFDKNCTIGDDVEINIVE